MGQAIEPAGRKQRASQGRQEAGRCDQRCIAGFWRAVKARQACRGNGRNARHLKYYHLHSVNIFFAAPFRDVRAKYAEKWVKNFRLNFPGGVKLQKSVSPAFQNPITSSYLVITCPISRSSYPFGVIFQLQISFIYLFEMHLGSFPLFIICAISSGLIMNSCQSLEF